MMNDEMHNPATRHMGEFSEVRKRVEQQMRTLFEDGDLSGLDETQFLSYVKHHIRCPGFDYAVAYFLSSAPTCHHEKNPPETYSRNE